MNEYIIVKDTDVHKFVDSCNLLLSEGASPLGGICAYLNLGEEDVSKSINFCQSFLSTRHTDHKATDIFEGNALQKVDE